MNIQNKSFGKLVTIPKQLLTNKFLKQCTEGEIDKILLENVPLKQKKGEYLVLTKEEREALSQKKKNYKQKCYITLKDRKKREKLLRITQKYLPPKKKDRKPKSKLQKSINVAKNKFKNTFKKLTTKAPNEFNNFIKHITDLYEALKLSEYIEYEMYKYVLRCHLFDKLPQNIKNDPKFNNIKIYLLLYLNNVQLKYKIKIGYAFNEYNKFFNKSKTNILEELRNMQDYGLSFEDIKNKLLDVYFNILLIIVQDKNYTKNHISELYKILYNITEFILIVYNKSTINKALKKDDKKNIKREIDDTKLYNRLIDIYKFNFFKEIFSVNSIFMIDRITDEVYNGIIKQLESIISKIKPERLALYNTNVQTIKWFERKEIGTDTFILESLFNTYFTISSNQYDLFNFNTDNDNDYYPMSRYIRNIIKYILPHYQLGINNFNKINTKKVKINSLQFFECSNNLTTEDTISIYDKSIIKFFIVMIIINFMDIAILDINRDEYTQRNNCRRNRSIYKTRKLIQFYIGNRIYDKIKNDGNNLNKMEFKFILEAIYKIYRINIIVVYKEDNKYKFDKSTNIKISDIIFNIRNAKNIHYVYLEDYTINNDLVNLNKLKRINLISSQNKYQATKLIRDFLTNNNNNTDITSVSYLNDNITNYLVYDEDNNDNNNVNDN